MDECIGSVQDFEGGGESCEPWTGGGPGPTPRRQTHPLAYSTPESEEVDVALGSELRDGGIEGPVQIDQIPEGAVAAEELVGQGPAADEHLIGQLAPEHQVVSDSLGRVALGQAVEAGDTLGRTEEEVGVITRAHGEGIAILHPGRSQHSDGIIDGHVPGQAHPFGVWWCGLDHEMAQPARPRTPSAVTG